MVSASFIFFSFACAFDEAQEKVRPTAITPPGMYFVICCIFTVLLLYKKILEHAESERKRNRSQQVRQTDVAVQFGANTIGYSVYDLRTILRGIDVHSEWTLTEGQIHHPDDSFGDIGHIRIGRRA